MTEGMIIDHPKEMKARNCANCREWNYNSLGERECLQTNCKNHSEWVERVSSQPKE